jgi:hypothetical protein
VQGGVDAGGSRVPDPVLVDRLIAQRTTPTILFSAEQRPMTVAGVAEVGAPSMHRSIGVGQVGEEVSDEGLDGAFLR